MGIDTLFLELDHFDNVFLWSSQIYFFQAFRHMILSIIWFRAVIEHAYQLGNATQKQELLMELYSTELQLFKDLASVKESR